MNMSEQIHNEVANACATSVYAKLAPFTMDPEVRILRGRLLKLFYGMFAENETIVEASMEALPQALEEAENLLEEHRREHDSFVRYMKRGQENERR